MNRVFSSGIDRMVRGKAWIPEPICTEARG